MSQSRKNQHAALRRQWRKDGTYERLVALRSPATPVPACGICGALEPVDRKLDIDHCHKTDQPRGLLCRGCNMQLPRWPAWKLRAAAEYLERTESAA